MASITVRIDENTKQRIESLFSSMGMNVSTGVTMFFQQCLSVDGLPFQPKRKRQTLDRYLEEWYGKPIETVLEEAEARNAADPPQLLDWGEPVGAEVW